MVMSVAGRMKCPIQLLCK